MRGRGPRWEGRGSGHPCACAAPCVRDAGKRAARGSRSATLLGLPRVGDGAGFEGTSLAFWCHAEGTWGSLSAVRWRDRRAGPSVSGSLGDLGPAAGGVLPALPGLSGAGWMERRGAPDAWGSCWEPGVGGAVLRGAARGRGSWGAGLRPHSDCLALDGWDLEITGFANELNTWT